jgi:hypothetical protein
MIQQLLAAAVAVAIFAADGISQGQGAGRPGGLSRF